MPQFVHFKSQIGLDALILSSSYKKELLTLNMCFLIEIISYKIRQILNKW